MKDKLIQFAIRLFLNNPQGKAFIERIKASNNPFQNLQNAAQQSVTKVPELQNINEGFFDWPVIGNLLKKYSKNGLILLAIIHVLGGTQALAKEIKIEMKDMPKAVMAGINSPYVGGAGGDKDSTQLLKKYKSMSNQHKVLDKVLKQLKTDLDNGKINIDQIKDVLVKQGINIDGNDLNKAVQFIQNYDGTMTFDVSDHQINDLKANVAHSLKAKHLQMYNNGFEKNFDRLSPLQQFLFSMDPAKHASDFANQIIKSGMVSII